LTAKDSAGNGKCSTDPTQDWIAPGNPAPHVELLDGADARERDRLARARTALASVA